MATDDVLNQWRRVASEPATRQQCRNPFPLFTPHVARAPAPAPGPYKPKPPETFPVKLSVQLDAEERDTDLAVICSDALNELPLMVKIGERFSVEGSDLKLEKGEQLMLHFVTEFQRVQAVDMTDHSDLWLSVLAAQDYERLPLDARLDDKLFTGVKALSRSKPLPSIVRVLEGYGSGDETEHLDQEDIITISHIEEVTRQGTTQKIVIGTNQLGQRLCLHQDMECAYFTTMLSALFLHMSEIIEFNFPQRVRVVEKHSFETRQPKEEKVYKLLRLTKDIRVIASRVNEPRLLSIPIHVPLTASIVSVDKRKLQEFLPPLYPTLNLTWGYREFGRPELPDSLQEFSQPLTEVLAAWMDSYQGKERCCKVAGTSKKDTEEEMKQLVNYNKDLMHTISSYNMPSKPAVPSRSPSIRVLPPSPADKETRHMSLPKLRKPPTPSSPKPTKSSTLPENPNKTNSTQSSAISPLPSPRNLSTASSQLPTSPPPVPSKINLLDHKQPPPSPTRKQLSNPPKSPALGKTPEKKSVERFVPPEKFQTGVDGYEVPSGHGSDEESDGDDYEEVPEVAKGDNATKGNLENMCSELRKILEKKEKVIVKLREENLELIEKGKKLEKEKEQIRQSNLIHMDRIYDLQCEVDRLLSANDTDCYDLISPQERPLPALPVGEDAVVYSTPNAMAVQRACMPKADAEGISDILRQLNLSQYVNKFKAERIDGPLLMELDEVVLKNDLGMTGLHARKVLLEIKKHEK